MTIVLEVYRLEEKKNYDKGFCDHSLFQRKPGILRRALMSALQQQLMADIEVEEPI